MRSALTTVQIDHDLQAGTRRPVKSLTKLVVSSLDKWLAVDRNNTPISNWNSHVVQARTSHLVEVGLGNPRVPVVLQFRLRSIFTKLLCQSILVHRAIALKHAGSDPGFEDKPTTGIDSADLLAIVVKKWRTLVVLSERLLAKDAEQRQKNLQRRRVCAQSKQTNGRRGSPVSDHIEV